MKPRSRASRDPGPSPRAEQACRQVIRLIHERRLLSGDFLPSQQDLRRTLRASNDTLNAAMRRLVEAGIVVRRDRVGTQVADLANTRRFGWRVGVASFAAPARGPGSFYAELLHRTLSALDRAGCECPTYFRVDESRCHWPHTTADFPRLDEDVAAGRLDGLLMLTALDPADWNRLRRRGLPLLHVGDWSGMPSAVLIDRPRFVAESAGRLIARDCRRLMLLDILPESGAFSRQAAALEEEAARHHLPPRAIETLSFPPTDLNAGARVAAILTDRAPSRRPDALIVVDDHLALDLVRDLSRGPGYRPRMAFLTAHPFPLHLALPALPYAIDTQGMAETGARLLLDRLIDPALDDQHVWIAPLPETGRRHAPVPDAVGTGVT